MRSRASWYALSCALVLSLAAGPARAEGEEKKGEGPKEEKKEGGEGAKAEGEGGAPASTNPADSLIASDHYVSHWIKMPDFTATELLGSGMNAVSTNSGRAQVIVFLASWCEPCQQLMQDILRVQKKIGRAHV